MNSRARRRFALARALPRSCSTRSRRARHSQARRPLNSAFLALCRSAASPSQSKGRPADVRSRRIRLTAAAGARYPALRATPLRPLSGACRVAWASQNLVLSISKYEITPQGGLIMVICGTLMGLGISGVSFEQSAVFWLCQIARKNASSSFLGCRSLLEAIA